MERGLVMLLHSLIIGVVLYCIMVFGLNQPNNVAENRSILISSVVLIYMILLTYTIVRLMILSWTNTKIVCVKNILINVIFKSQIKK